MSRHYCLSFASLDRVDRLKFQKNHLFDLKQEDVFVLNFNYSQNCVSKYLHYLSLNLLSAISDMIHGLKFIEYIPWIEYPAV